MGGCGSHFLLCLWPPCKMMHVAVPVVLSVSPIGGSWYISTAVACVPSLMPVYSRTQSVLHKGPFADKCLVYERLVWVGLKAIVRRGAYVATCSRTWNSQSSPPKTLVRNPIMAWQTIQMSTATTFRGVQSRTPPDTQSPGMCNSEASTSTDVQCCCL